jgi:uncharacterized protein
MILDTGILLAAAIRGDKHHRQAKALLAGPERKVIPEPVVVEASYMMASRLGAAVELSFQRSLLSRSFVVEQITRADRERVVEILGIYADARLGYVDACVVVVAERLGEQTIATLDRRDFSIVRPRHTAAFTLVP